MDVRRKSDEAKMYWVSGGASSCTGLKDAKAPKQRNGVRFIWCMWDPRSTAKVKACELILVQRGLFQLP